MSTLYSLLEKGGLVMIPIGGLSIGTVACGLERGWFWYRLSRQEHRIVNDVLRAAALDLEKAKMLVEQVQHLPIGRFMRSPLSLHRPTPETFRLALETAADREMAEMQKGDKLLETTISLAPLLGLLGTVAGLMTTFFSLNIGKTSGAIDLTGVSQGISQDLVATASSMVVAVIATFVLRVQVSMRARQERLFSDVAGELELIYRQIWYDPIFRRDEYLSMPPLPIEVTLRIVGATQGEHIIKSAVVSTPSDSIEIHISSGQAHHPSTS
jgi:biopolymer transport protein ExbB